VAGPTVKKVREWLDGACRSPNEKVAKAAEGVAHVNSPSPRPRSAWCVPALKSDFRLGDNSDTILSAHFKTSRRSFAIGTFAYFSSNRPAYAC